MQRESVDLYCSAEFKEIKKKHRSFEGDLEKALTLVNQQLCPKKTGRPLTSKHLNHLHDGEGFQVWKFQVMVQGLRPGQWPRVWLGVTHEFELIVPLVLDMHGNNYDDSTHQREAIRTMGTFYKEMASN